MKAKTHAVIVSLILMIVIIHEACQKPENPVPVPPVMPPGNTTGPQLPASLFNYSNLDGNIPPYILNYIHSNPSIDNTPANNPITNAGATLGRVLFYDKNLSFNNTTSCASCHHQDKAFTDGLVQSKGFMNGFTRRNSISLTNVRYFSARKMFWDMRASDLETQTLMPIKDPVEMGMPSLNALENKLKTLPYYGALFNAAFGTPDITADKISKALSQFIRSIISFNSKYDQGLANNFANFTQQEKDGKTLVGSLNCVECHSDLSHVSTRTNPSFLIVENSGINTGFGSNNALDLVYTDNGIGEVTGLAKDLGTFKIPTLRNVELTAPYMHDGRFTTLEQVIDHYNTGVKNNPNRGIQLPNGGYRFLTDQDKQALISFLKTLTDASLATDPKYADPFH